MAVILQYRPRVAQPAVAESCRWHEALEQITASNLRLACAWQRTIWRFMWCL